MTVPAGAPLRGDVPIRTAMEQLQVGYLHAVAATAGCSLSSPIPDRGIDWHIDHASSQHTVDSEVTIKVALKSTFQVQALPPAPYFSFTLDNDHLEKLSGVAPTIHRLLVVMVVPRMMQHWVLSTGNFLQLRHCAYWVNLAGQAITGKDKTNVHVQTDHVFDDLALCEIMKTVGQGGVPQ